ncbi:hypothetical protein N3K66_000059 [Trichothecium roseum]|uniref:Uncharacterized protein n=1 Tax=Trichothecium roseum TaxID=47278 RepID=A0ACC0VCU3_9HYPO|nr:hypothetical protein N3K66_000059 [Trichothecium roseum]
MLNSRRAIAAAAFILVVIFLITRSHTSSSDLGTPITHHSKAGSDTDGTGKDDGQQHAGKPAAAAAHQEPPRPQSQKPMMDMSRMSVYDKLGYAYDYDMETKFPAYIWQTWKHKPTDADFMFLGQERSWTELHPGFVHEVVTDDVAYSMLRLFYAAVPEVLEAYRALPLPVLKADFFRYLILFARGGIYSDIDTYAIQSAAEWIPSSIPRETIGLVIGIEADPDRPDWAEWYSRRIQFCQWTIQAKSGHPVLRDIIARITKQTLEYKRAGKIAKFLGSNVVELTGPAVWTDVIFDYFNDERYFDMTNSKGAIDWRNFTGMETGRRVGDVVVLPITSFSPGVGQMGAGEVDDPMAFVKHDFEGTWKPESERHIGEQQEQ